MDRSTLTRNLKPLINSGLLRFSPAENGKHKAVEVTLEGKAALLKSGPYWEQAQGHLVSRIGPDAWGRIVADLSSVVDATRSSGM